MKKRLSFLAALVISFSASAVVITPTYNFSSVYQDSGGVLYGAAASGRTDVTSGFKNNVDVSIGMWMNAILCDWTLGITFNFANLGAGTVANATINSFDVNNRSATGTINFNTNSGFSYFIDSTPTDNTEFSLATSTLALGGGNVNNQRFGNATASGATNRWDLFTLSLHEVEHTLGVSSASALFLGQAGATGAASDPLRMLTISNSISGLASDFQIPFVPNSAHIAGAGTNSAFNFTVVADPGWQIGQRALPTGLDILAVAQINNCDDFNLNPAQVPEPGALALALASAGVLFVRRRR